VKRTKIIQVFGKVQNVGFRHATVLKANELNIKGFVKNMPDKSVYIEAQGNAEDLEFFILWCHEGPNWARVNHVTVSETNAKEYSIFSRK